MVFFPFYRQRFAVEGYAAGNSLHEKRDGKEADAGENSALR